MRIAMIVATIVACSICFVVVANVIAYQTVFQPVHLLYLDSFFDTPRVASTAEVLAKQNIAIFYNTFLREDGKRGEKERIGLSRDN
jgi:hypothetical protein